MTYKEFLNSLEITEGKRKRITKDCIEFGYGRKYMSEVDTPREKAKRLHEIEATYDCTCFNFMGQPAQEIDHSVKFNFSL